MAAVKYETHSTGLAVPSSVVSSSSDIMIYNNTQTFVHISNLTFNHYLVQHVSTYVVIARY
jgi:hypothetical protein